MKLSIIITLFLFFIALFPKVAIAQAGQAGEIVQEPICFILLNEAEQTVFGAIRTDAYTNPDGSKSRHTSNFRLEAAGTMNEEGTFPVDRAEFCSYGPFFEGRKLELTLKTLFPVFDCKTNVESGPVVITRKEITDDPMGGYKLSATCH